MIKIERKIVKDKLFFYLTEQINSKDLNAFYK